METLKSHKFVQYFAKPSGFTGTIKDSIQPPKTAKEIFIGGGIIGSGVVKVGVFGTPKELLDQRKYPRNRDTQGKPVRKYYAYYDSGAGEPIGFSKIPTIRLDDDTPDGAYIYIKDETKLSAFTTGDFTLWRCGSSNWRDQDDFDDTYQIQFYYRKK